MPNCPNCGTWNPDDKTVCWRCQTELPKPQEKKKKTPRRFAGLPLYLWIAMVFFIVMLIASQCFVSELTRLAG
jgi:predicted nucleic acid-binding Zn ribbon protein